MLSLILLLVIGVSCEQVCYPNIGCFTDDPPFQDFPLPQSPEEQNIQLWLYTRGNRNTKEIVPFNKVGRHFGIPRRSFFIVHGFTGHGEDDWVQGVKNNLLTKGDFNVFVVEWSVGAGITIIPNSPASNGRVVGAVIAWHLSHLYKTIDYITTQATLMGHSIGAHACGTAGKRLASHFGNPWKIGRITGLDPVGTGFFDKGVRGRLDKSDAQFVDVIHTCGNSTDLQMGYGAPIGHVDFFPNGDGEQPGCDYEIMPSLCSHFRALDLYEESVTSGCHFTSNPCPAGFNGNWDLCKPCSGSTCQFLGFNADRSSARGVFHLRTKAAKPYCIS